MEDEEKQEIKKSEPRKDDGKSLVGRKCGRCSFQMQIGFAVVTQAAGLNSFLVERELPPIEN